MQVVLFLWNLQSVELVWASKQDQTYIYISMQGWWDVLLYAYLCSPVPVPCRPSSPHASLLLSKTTAEVVKANTLHRGLCVDLLCPLYTIWRSGASFSSRSNCPWQGLVWQVCIFTRQMNPERFTTCIEVKQFARKDQGNPCNVSYVQRDNGSLNQRVNMYLSMGCMTVPHSYS